MLTSEGGNPHSVLLAHGRGAQWHLECREGALASLLSTVGTLSPAGLFGAALLPWSGAGFVHL